MTSTRRTRNHAPRRGFIALRNAVALFLAFFLGRVIPFPDANTLFNGAAIPFIGTHSESCAPVVPILDDYPIEGGRLDLEGIYVFGARAPQNVDSYRWEFRQNEMLLLSKELHDSGDGSTRSVMIIGESSEEHRRFSVGAMELRVSTMVCGRYGPSVSRVVSLIPRAL